MPEIDQVDDNRTSVQVHVGLCRMPHSSRATTRSRLLNTSFPSTSTFTV